MQFQVLKVLIIEDDTDVRQSLVQALREDGYAADSAPDGEEGLYKARYWDYDAIILDIMLPKLDGWSVLEQLRRDKGTPVLMLTARDHVKHRIRGLDSGADDYLTKPYDLDELLARLRALIRRSSGLTGNTIELGAVIVDLAQHRVSKEDERISLTATEYRIIAYLARRADNVVSRSHLCDAIFDEEEEAFSNALDVHIYNIRQKLGKDFIKNRRGLGYVISKP
ncbi:MAG: response regulator transcription factor [Verrucomicrobiota bacterium]